MIPNRERPQEEPGQLTLDEYLRLLLDTHFEKGFIMLTIAYMDKLLGYISTRFGQCDAEEIVQCVWMKAWQTLQTYGTTRIRTLKLGSWLYTIARNQALNVLKHNSSLEVFSFDTPEGKAYVESHPHGQSSSLEDEVVHQEDLENLFLCIAQLPSTYHTVITLYYFAQLSYPEIALILNKPLNTVKSDGLRAIRLLRLKMQRINQD